MLASAAEFALADMAPGEINTTPSGIVAFVLIGMILFWVAGLIGSIQPVQKTNVSGARAKKVSLGIGLLGTIVLGAVAIVLATQSF